MKKLLVSTLCISMILSMITGCFSKTATPDEDVIIEETVNTPDDTTDDNMDNTTGDATEIPAPEAPVETPVTKPVETPTTKPVEKPVTKPVETPTTKPVEKPVTKPVEKPVTPKGPAVSDIASNITKKISAAGIADISADISTSYNIDTALLEEYTINTTQISTSTVELAIFKVKDSKNIATVKKAIEKRVEKLKEAAFYPAQVENVNNYKIYTNGNYIMLSIVDADNQELVKNVFDRTFDSSIKEIFAKIDRIEGVVKSYSETTMTVDASVLGATKTFTITIPEGTYIETHGEDKKITTGSKVSVVFEAKLPSNGPYSAVATFIEIL